MGERIGILGGVFDPAHNGHLLLARAARLELGLDRVILLPSGDPPHKRPSAEKEDRLHMLRLAAGEEMEVSEREIFRPGTTYTVDTLSELKRETPEAEIIYIVGADTVGQLLSWRDFDRVAKMCSFAAAARPGAQGDAPAGARVYWLQTPGPDISSTQVRFRARKRENLAGLVPEAVARYIRERGLYLMGMSEKAALERLRATLTEHRFRHTLGVRDTAERLARLHGLDPAAARVAGLLHDAAKSMDLAEMRGRVAEAGIQVDALEWQSEQLLHAAAGMAVAEREYGVLDQEILSAIRRHTLGGPGMTPLEMVIFVADFIEPNRQGFPGLEEVRGLAEADLREAAARSAELTDDYLRQRGREPHPGTEKLVCELREEMR